MSCAGKQSRSAAGGDALLRREHPWNRVLLILTLVWVFLLGCTQMRSTDIWTHIRTGQLIIERGDVPWVDWYTFTDWNNDWIDLHWLFQVLAALLYAWGGVELLVLVKAGCLTVTVAIGWRASGSGLPDWGKFACWILPIVCLSGRALVRPEMLTLIFLALWLWIMFGIHERPHRVWWLPVVQIAWTNCHGLFVLGPVVGAAYLVDRVWRRLSGGRWSVVPTEDRLPVSHLLIVAVLSLLASLVNPYFEEGALYPFVLYGELSDLAPLENQPPIWFARTYGFANVFLLAEIGVWGLTAGSFLWLARERRCDLMRLLLFAAFSHLAWHAQRNTNIFSLVSAVVCCLNCGDALRLRAARRVPPPSVSPAETTQSAGRRLPAQLTCAAIAVWCVCIVTNRWSRWNGEGVRFGIGEREAYYIHDAARFAGQEGFPDRALIAQFGHATVYIFHNAPERKVYLDGRLDVVSPETELTYFEILDAIATGNRTWESFLRDSDGNLPAVILDSRDARPLINGLYATPGWRMVFADSTAAVFVEADLAERLQLPAADPAPLFNPPMWNGP